MTVRQIAYRLKSEGKAEVVRDAREVGAAHQAAYAAAQTAADQATAAADRQERKLRALATAARDAASAAERQAAFNRVMGVDMATGGSARQSAAVFIEMEAQEERARRLRAAIDPLWAAQDRLNDELREAQSLYRAGAISAKELADAQGLARRRFDETAGAIQRQQAGLSRLAVASRLNLARQGADVAVTAAMGMNPAMIAIQQGPQILDAWATSGIRVSGVMMGMGVAFGVAATAAGVLAAAWHGGEASALAYQRTITGLGRTSGLTARELETLTEAAAEQGRVSIGTAREQMAAYLATGRVGGEVAQRLTVLGKDFASVMGVEATEATKMLAAAMMAPDKAARDLTRGGLGLLDQKTLDLIDSLVKSGDLLRAQKILLDALEPSVRGHASQVGKIESAWDGVSRAIRGAWSDLGKFLYRTEDEELAQLDRRIVQARGLLDGADARHRPGYQSAVTKLEQRRAEIMRSQADAAYQSRIAAGNQAAQLDRDRRDAAARANRGGRSGDGEAEAEREAREALQRRRREEDIEHAREMQIAQALQDWGHIRALEEEERIRSRIRQLVDDGESQDAARTKAMAEQAALREAMDVQMGREAQALIDAASIEADRAAGLERYAGITERRLELEARIVAYAKVYQDIGTATSAAMRDQLMIDQARADAMERIVRAAQAERRLALARARGDREETEREEREARIEAESRAIEQRERLNPGEARRRAEQLIAEEDDAAALGRRRAWLEGLIGDIRRGVVKNALGEQLEGAAERLDEKLADSAIKFGIAMARALMDSGKFNAPAMNWLMKGLDFLFVGKNAAGTDFWPGGLTWVGERGPELLDLPRGSKVFEADRSRQMALQAGAGGRSPAVHVTLHQTFDARGAGPREIDALREEMARERQRLPAEVTRIVQDGMIRGAL